MKAEKLIRRLRLVNYRSFRDFSTTFPVGACLVGPNNAGKSTILTALRLADSLLRVAWARRATLREVHKGSGYFAYPISLSDFPTLRESLRHEFRNEEARLELTWTNGNRLVAVWPPGDGHEDLYGYFFLQLKAGSQPATVAAVRKEFPRLGIVPLLTPLDQTEAVLSEEYVRSNITSRLSSRHFRNQLGQLEAKELQDFRDFATPWLPGVTIGDLTAHDSPDGQALSLYLHEDASRVPKEVTWAGDGIQIWLQLLFHIFRLRASDVIILDEPDVYLHADLQRRLVLVLESVQNQTILATHSPEIVAQLDRKNVLWVDKSRRSAAAVKDEALMQELTDTLGSQFNLSLAKAMSSRAVLFVEGKDMRILRHVARTVGATRLAAEAGVVVVPLTGYTKADQVDAFKWVVSEFLQGSVRCFMLLDRDYRSDAIIAEVERRYAHISVDVHVWRRKELESYLVNSAAMSRLTGASESEIESILAGVAAEMETDVFARMLDERIRAETSARAHAVSITSTFKSEFDERWRDPRWRLDVIPPKLALARVNQVMQDSGRKTLSPDRLAKTLTIDEVPAEMRRALLKVDEAAV